MTRSSRSDEAVRERLPGKGSQRLPAAARLRRGSDIRRVLRTGRRMPGSLVDVITAPSSQQRPRFGVIVPRYGHTAVARNRVRRRLRELARTEWLPAARAAECHVDLILRAKPSSYDASYEGLRKALQAPFGKLCE